MASDAPTIDDLLAIVRKRTPGKLTIDWQAKRIEKLEGQVERLTRDLEAALQVMANHDLSLHDVLVMPLKQTVEIDRLKARISELESQPRLNITDGGRIKPMPLE